MHLGSLSSENTLVSIQMCTTLLPPNFQLLYLQRNIKKTYLGTVLMFNAKCLMLNTIHSSIVNAPRF